MDTIPTFSAELIQHLDTSYPLRNPLLSESEKEIMYRAGQRSVVEMLISKLKTSEDNILNNY